MLHTELDLFFGAYCCWRNENLDSGNFFLCKREVLRCYNNIVSFNNPGNVGDSRCVSLRLGGLSGCGGCGASGEVSLC